MSDTANNLLRAAAQMRRRGYTNGANPVAGDCLLRAIQEVVVGDRFALDYQVLERLPEVQVLSTHLRSSSYWSHGSTATANVYLYSDTMFARAADGRGMDWQHLSEAEIQSLCVDLTEECARILEDAARSVPA